MAARDLSEVQMSNCNPDSTFLWVRCPPKKTGFNPFGQGKGAAKSRAWAEQEIKRVVGRFNAPVKQITFQKNRFQDGKGFSVSAYVWFGKGMHPKVTKKLKKGKPVKRTRIIHVRKDHDSEKFGEPIREWEWRFVPATCAPLTKKKLARRKNVRNQEEETKSQELDLSSDSDTDDAEDLF